MAKKNDLTGGTGDVNPQLFKFPTVGNATGQTPATGLVTNSVTMPLPVNRFQEKKGRSIVVEVLKTRWSVATNQLVNKSSGLYTFSGYIATNANPSPVQTQGRVIDFLTDEQQIAYAAMNGGQTILGNPQSTTTNSYPVEHDLTDGAGHGILVATDSLTLTGNAQVFDSADGSASPIYSQVPNLVNWVMTVELLYRFKEVSLQEYIGIVQSQQGGV